MTRAFALLCLMILAGCAGPEFERQGTEKAPDMAEPMVDAAPVAAAPVSPAEICDEPGDGIGGTGCAVE